MRYFLFLLLKYTNQWFYCFLGITYHKENLFSSASTYYTMNICRWSFYWCIFLVLLAFFDNTEAGGAVRKVVNTAKKVVNTVRRHYGAWTKEITTFFVNGVKRIATRWFRRGRSVSETTSPCSCANSLEVSRFNTFTTKHLAHTKVNVAVKEVNDVHGNSLYDIIEFSVYERKVGNRYVKISNETYNLYVDTSEWNCDCTSILKRGEFSLTAEGQNDELHGVLAEYIKGQENAGKDNKIMVIAVITGSVVIVIAASVLVALVWKQKRMVQSQVEMAQGAVDNTAYVTTDEKQ